MFFQEKKTRHLDANYAVTTGILLVTRLKLEQRDVWFPQSPKFPTATLYWCIIPRNPFSHNKTTIPESLVKAIFPSAIQHESRVNWQWRLSCQFYGCNGKKDRQFKPPPTQTPHLYQDSSNMMGDWIYQHCCSLPQLMQHLPQLFFLWCSALQCIKWTLEAGSTKWSNDSLQTFKFSGSVAS